MVKKLNQKKKIEIKTSLLCLVCLLTFVF